MKENHHYVSQFYLRFFSWNNQNIVTYKIDDKKYIPVANIKGQAIKKKLYGETEDIENALMKIEYNATNVLREVLRINKLPNKKYES